MVLDPILVHYFNDLTNIKVTIINNGLINKTFLITDKEKHYILQKINTQVFNNPNNIITNHQLLYNTINKENYRLEISSPIKTLMGDNFVEIDSNFWRMVSFIKNSHTLHTITTPEIAFKAAKAFSHFYSEINSKSIKIKEVLPDFINFKKRIDDFKSSVKTSTYELKTSAETEIDFIQKNINLVDHWLDLKSKNKLPDRIIHADPKISNILFDKQENPISIIDLDTVMHESILYDFGDMIRSYTNKTTEDNIENPDNFSQEIYNAAKKGFLFDLKNALTKVELDNLDYAAQLIIYIQAVRFLTDYLNGSVYYQTNYPEQNLNRTKNQIYLLKGVVAYLKV